MSDEGKAAATPQSEKLPAALAGEIRLMAENIAHAICSDPVEMSEARRRAAAFYSNHRAEQLRLEMKKPPEQRDQGVLKSSKECPPDLLDEFSGAAIAERAHRIAKGFVLRRIGLMVKYFEPEAPVAPPDQAPASESSQEVPAATVT